MNRQTMSAAEFRTELKRLDLNQSTFATLAEVPLRTVQSWALGERKIPGTVAALIEKVERLPEKDKLLTICTVLPEKKQAAIINIAKLMNAQTTESQALARAYMEEMRALRIAHAKDVKALRDQVRKALEERDNLKAELTETKAELDKVHRAKNLLERTCVFQANKIQTNAEEERRRAERAIPFNG